MTIRNAEGYAFNYDGRKTFIPQNLSDSDATKQVSATVKAMLKDKTCRSFLDAMLSNLGSYTHVSPRAKTFNGVLKQLAKNPGFYDSSGSRDYGISSLTPDLHIGINFAKSQPAGQHTVGVIAIEEIFHAAASQGLYKHYPLAQVAFDVGRRMNLVPAGVRPPIPPSLSNEDPKYNSDLLDHAVMAACQR